MLYSIANPPSDRRGLGVEKMSTVIGDNQNVVRVVRLVHGLNGKPQCQLESLLSDLIKSSSCKRGSVQPAPVRCTPS
jgi:hypothetical protein